MDSVTTTVLARLKLWSTSVRRCVGRHNHHRQQGFLHDWVDEDDRRTMRALTLAVGGKSGAGKSSLVNRLVRRDIFKSDPVWACTKQAQSVFLDSDERKDITRLGVLITDLPGLADGVAPESGYVDLYRSWWSYSTVMVYLVRAEDRALEPDLRLFDQAAQHGRVVFALSQSDRITPYKEWDAQRHRPGTGQRENLALKAKAVASEFGVAEELVVPISASESWGLDALMDAVEGVLSGRLPSSDLCAPRNRREAELIEATSHLLCAYCGRPLGIRGHPGWCGYCCAERNGVVPVVPLGRKPCRWCGNVSFDRAALCPSCGTADWWT